MSYIVARDALHTTLETGVPGYLTTANVTNGDHSILDTGIPTYAAILERGDSAVQDGPENTTDWVYEILVELWVRYSNEKTAKDNLNSFIESVRARIEKNPGLLGSNYIVAEGTLISAIDQPQEMVMRGVSSNPNAVPVFLMAVMHVQIEYRAKLTGGEFR